jgi:SagB-type dehydrogenase family enzyme
LWATQGITGRGATSSKKFRAAPSAGATYPLELRIIKQDGVFKYIPDRHTIIKEQSEDLRVKLAQTALGQEFIEDAECDFVISAVYERTVERYEERAERYVHIEVGHAAENLLLQAIALGLGSVPVGAFYDDRVKKLLKLPQNEAPVYIIAVGYSK